MAHVPAGLRDDAGGGDGTSGGRLAGRPRARHLAGRSYRIWCWPATRALLLTAVASICYLIQERRLKSKKPARLLERLPPLATLDNLISRSLGLGFVLITLAWCLVIMWAFIYSGTRWISDPRVTVSLFTWALLVAELTCAPPRAGAGEKRR